MNWDAIGARAELIAAIGMVDKTFFDSKFKSIDSIFQSPGVQRWWSEKGVNILAPHFVQLVEKLIESNGS